MKQTYIVRKTNKKTVEHCFDSLAALSQYATKNRYGQGFIELFTTYQGQTYHVKTFFGHCDAELSLSSLYSLNEYCTKMRLAEIETQGVSK